MKKIMFNICSSIVSYVYSKVTAQSNFQHSDTDIKYMVKVIRSCKTYTQLLACTEWRAKLLGKIRISDWYCLIDAVNVQHIYLDRLHDTKQELEA